jgi:UDP-GlcNAc:undecaprenyl-phosphate GlcNAc-1-phosphate transferase
MPQVTGWFSSDVLVLVAWGLAAFALSSLLIPLCRKTAFRYGCVARPREDRWHRQPTPLLGGAAIVLPALGLSMLAGDTVNLAVPLATGLVIFLVGITDDVITLKPATKLIAEIALASVFLLFGARLHWTSSLTLDTLLTLVWLVGVTNAFNLLDNMDGLCGGIAIIAGGTLIAGLFSRAGLGPETRYLAIVLGATAGFLVRNVHPASIFMGDGGSLFLGLTLSGLALSGAGGAQQDRSNVLSIVLAPMLIVLIPIFDTTLVTVARVLSGRRVSQGGRDHSSHRLVAIGLSERAAVTVLWTLSLGGAAAASAVRSFSGGWAVLVAALFMLGMVLFAVYLAQVRVYEDPERGLPPGVTPVVVDFMHKRRVGEVLLDSCLVAIAYYAAWRLRFDGPEWPYYFEHFLESLPIAIAVQLSALFVVGAYRGLWRHFGLMDGVVFTKSVGLGTLGMIVAIVYWYGFGDYSRGVFVMYAALLMLMLLGSRSSFRLIGEFARRRRAGTRLVIYGAGEAGALVAREMLSDVREPFRILGFIDDDPKKQRLRLSGYSVLGGEKALLSLIQDEAVDVVVISARRFDDLRLHRVERACKAKNVRLMRFHFQLEALGSSA